MLKVKVWVKHWHSIYFISKSFAVLLDFHNCHCVRFILEELHLAIFSTAKKSRTTPLQLPLDLISGIIYSSAALLVICSLYFLFLHCWQMSLLIRAKAGDYHEPKKSHAVGIMDQYTLRGYRPVTSIFILHQCSSRSQMKNHYWNNCSVFLIFNSLCKYLLRNRLLGSTRFVAAFLNHWQRTSTTVDWPQSSFRVQSWLKSLKCCAVLSPHSAA